MYLACFNWVLFLGSSKSEIKVFLCVLMSSLVIEGSTPELFQLVAEFIASQVWDQGLRFVFVLCRGSRWGLLFIPRSYLEVPATWYVHRQFAISLFTIFQDSKRISNTVCILRLSCSVESDSL